jgi:ATPase family AAA domain-containing protein 3A/B
MEKKAEDYRNSLQQEAQVKAQALRFEDELARKRMQVLDSLLLYFF